MWGGSLLASVPETRSPSQRQAEAWRAEQKLRPTIQSQKII